MYVYIFAIFCSPSPSPIDKEKGHLIDVLGRAPLDLLAGLARNEIQLCLFPPTHPTQLQRTSLIVECGSQAVGRIFSQNYEDKFISTLENLP